MISSANVEGEVIVISDGSTDRTASIARDDTSGFVRVIESARRRGKAAALTEAAAVARHAILVFADARQTWSADAIGCLLDNFARADVGAVGGELMLESGPGVVGGVGLYWRYEKWLRGLESRWHSTVGVSGAISAVRRELFCPIPPGTILDDIFWPLHVVMRGFRVIHDPRARAFDRLPQKGADEFRRKVRTLSGNFQLCARLPAALLPWRNPIWFQFVSHKLLRLLVPWALLAMIVLSAALPGRTYRLASAAEAAICLIALTGGRSGPKVFRKLAAAAGSFLLLNTAAFVAFWVWLAGRAERSWTKACYDPVPKVTNAAT